MNSFLYTLLGRFCGMVLFLYEDNRRESNIRISPRSRAALRKLARREGKPMQAVLDEAIDHYQRDKFLAEVHAAYAALQADRKHGKKSRTSALWDKTLEDGLKDE